MRALILIAVTALTLSGCVARDPVTPPAQTPTPVAPRPQVVHSNLIGATAGQLIHLFGQPALQVREGPGLKLQFRGQGCVLDTYLYPQGTSGERVTYVDARLPSGNDTSTQDCIAAQMRRIP